MTAITQYTAGDNKNFYPTPLAIAEKLLGDVLNTNKVRTVLEPSAGKGDLVDVIVARNNQRSSYNKIEIDCIELDINLRGILNSKGTEHVQVIHDNFLTFNTHKIYDLIVMNPPFDRGTEHLLKAITLQERHGGSIRCILNAQSIKNPYTNKRKELKTLLNKYNATIDYLDNAFSNSDRSTDVEIVLIKINIPKVELESDFFTHFQKAEEIKKEYYTKDVHEIGFNNLLENLVAEYNIEVNATIKFIQEYEALKEKIPRRINAEDSFNKDPLLKLTMNHDNNEITINEYLENVRLKYWNYIMNKEEITGKLTSKLRAQYLSQVESMAKYDFTLFNLQKMVAEINVNIITGIKSSIEDFFDTLTIKHTWHPDCSKNIHLYNGWKTNKAHYVNEKVVIPVRDIFDIGYTWSTGKMRAAQVLNILKDIEHIFKYLNGETRKDFKLEDCINKAIENGLTKNIEFEYFYATFYKKGTMHLKFKNKDLLARFNIFVAQQRSWLPPCYGNKEYTNMTQEEKDVIDSFQGERAYNAVMNNKAKYLINLDKPEQLVLA